MAKREGEARRNPTSSPGSDFFSLLLSCFSPSQHLGCPLKFALILFSAAELSPVMKCFALSSFQFTVILAWCGPTLCWLPFSFCLFYQLVQSFCVFQSKFPFMDSQVHLTFLPRCSCRGLAEGLAAFEPQLYARDQSCHSHLEGCCGLQSMAITWESGTQGCGRGSFSLEWLTPPTPQ